MGTLDTNSEEYSWLRSQVKAAGYEIIAVNVGSLTDGSPTDVMSSEVRLAIGRGRRAAAAGA